MDRLIDLQKVAEGFMWNLSWNEGGTDGAKERAMRRCAFRTNSCL